MQNIIINILQFALEQSNENNNSLNSMTITNLKDACRVHRLSASELKKNLVEQASAFIESLVARNNIGTNRLLDGSENSCLCGIGTY